MSFNSSPSYAYNYSNDYYPHMNKDNQKPSKPKSKYQIKRIFEIERQAVICLIVAVLLFGLIYSIIMKRKIKKMKNVEPAEEEKQTTFEPPMNSSQSMQGGSTFPVMNNCTPVQPNPAPFQTPVNTAPVISSTGIPSSNLSQNPLGL